MSIWRVALAVILPPLAVLDKGCGTATLVTIFTLMGWMPGVIMALVIIGLDSREKDKLRVPIEVRVHTEQPGGPDRRFIEIPVPDDEAEEDKRKGAYVRLADGTVAEVIEDDMRQDKRKRGLL